MMTIRPATRADIPTLQALAHSIWNHVYPSIISQDQIDFMLTRMYDTAQIELEMKSGYEWELIEENALPIGFISTRVENAKAMKVSKIYLEPAFHGKGYGQTALKHVDDKAKKAGVEWVYLFVNRFNERAVRAYLRAGYSIVETLDQAFGNFVLNDYKLSKTL